MKTAFATALLTATLAAATLPAQAAGWGDTLRQGASQLSGGSGNAAGEGAAPPWAACWATAVAKAPAPVVWQPWAWAA